MTKWKKSYYCFQQKWSVVPISSIVCVSTPFSKDCIVVVLCRIYRHREVWKGAVKLLKVIFLPEMHSWRGHAESVSVSGCLPRRPEALKAVPHASTRGVMSGVTRTRTRVPRRGSGGAWCHNPPMGPTVHCNSRCPCQTASDSCAFMLKTQKVKFQVARIQFLSVTFKRQLWWSQG